MMQGFSVSIAPVDVTRMCKHGNSLRCIAACRALPRGLRSGINAPGFSRWFFLDDDDTRGFEVAMIRMACEPGLLKRLWANNHA